MLVAIAKFYAKDAGVTKNIEIDETANVESGPFAAYSIKKDIYLVMVDIKTGKLNHQAFQKYNVINSFAHEKKHDEDHKTAQPLYHVDAILTQIDHKSFSKTETEFKQAMGGYAATLLNEALQKGASLSSVKDKMEEVNKSKLGSFISLVYDEKSKEVIKINLEAGVIVTGTRKKKSKN